MIIIIKTNLKIIVYIILSIFILMNCDLINPFLNGVKIYRYIQIEGPLPTPLVTDPPLSAWPYRAVITISENAGTALTNYAVPITLTNTNFNYNNVLGSNGEDLRFIYNNNIFLSYWIENWSKNGTSKIWVKLPILAAHQDTTIHLYYGIAGLNAKSDPDAVFLLYDDFNDNSINTNKWVDISKLGLFLAGRAEESDYRMKLYNNDPDLISARGFLRSQNTFPANISCKFIIRLSNMDESSIIAAIHFDGLHNTFGVDVPNNAYYLHWTSNKNPSNSIMLYKNINGNSVEFSPSFTPLPKNCDTIDHIIELNYYNQLITVYFDNTMIIQLTDNENFTTRYIGFTSSLRNSNNFSEIDNVIVRSYVTNEPAVTNIGAEESLQ